jgi:PAS domain S-box-containing protein
LLSVPPRESELEQFFDLSLDLLYIAGFDGYFKRVNRAFERTLGYAREELLSQPFIEFVHPDDLQATRDVLADLARGEDVTGYEGRFICADGTVRWLQSNTRTVPDRDVIYCVARDVTDRRQADEELREAQRMVEATAEELRMLAETQAALRRVAVLVARAASPAEVFAAVVEEVGWLLRVGVTLMVRFEEDETATVVADWSDRDTPRLTGARVPLAGENLTVMVRRTGRPARIEDFAQASGVIAETARTMGVHSGVGAPIVVEGSIWGAMIAVSQQPEPLPIGTEGRIGEFTQLVATAISTIEARTELAASRARILAATDAERRRVVRDLHDGAQQRLVHTVITLKLAQRALEGAGEPGRSLMAEALQHAERATAELRELSHGILPRVLTRGGLRAGVDELASRMPLPVENGVSVGRLPAPVESTAYFVVSEALTNVVKHAHAGHAEVTAHLQGDMLVIGVRDDGIGGARPEGSGLVGLADRLAALDGTLRIESSPEGGTLLAADIPLDVR